MIDFGPIAFLAIVGVVSLFGFFLPGAVAVLFSVICKLLTGVFSYKIMMIGSGIGLIPGLILLYSINKD